MENNKLVSKKAVAAINLTINKMSSSCKTSFYRVNEITVLNLVNAWQNGLLVKSDNEKYEDFIGILIEITKAEIDYLNVNTSSNGVLLLKRKGYEND